MFSLKVGMAHIHRLRKLKFRCCGLIFVISSTPQNPQKFIHHKNFYAYGKTLVPEPNWV